MLLIDMRKKYKGLRRDIIRSDIYYHHDRHLKRCLFAYLIEYKNMTLSRLYYDKHIFILLIPVLHPFTAVSRF